MSFDHAEVLRSAAVVVDSEFGLVADLILRVLHCPSERPGVRDSCGRISSEFVCWSCASPVHGGPHPWPCPTYAGVASLVVPAG